MELSREAGGRSMRIEEERERNKKSLSRKSFKL